MITMTRDAMKLLHEGSEVLSEIEHNGVRVNVDYLKSTTERTEGMIAELEIQIRKDEVGRLWRKTYGDRTKFGSRDQLVDIVFHKLGYEIKGVTLGGRAVADKDALDDIDLPFIDSFLRVESLKKTLGTYLYGIKKEMVKDDSFWYIHPNYNLHTVSTFRSSSDHPNFQNFPKRNPEMAELIRPCFQAHPGHHLVEMDFSQIEVRVSACYTDDPVLKKYVCDPATDMHGDTAAQLFLLKKEDICKKTTRDSAKNQWVFPQFYGSTYFNCAKAIWKAIKKRDFRVGKNNDGGSLFDHLKSKGISERGLCDPKVEPIPGSFEEHCRKIEKDFWNRRFKVYTAWKKSWYEQYLRDGGFRMLTGFAVNGLLSRNDATNFPIQGSAFHCLLWCLVEMNKWLRKYNMMSKLIGEIHDSALLSVHPAELQDVLSHLHHLMTKAVLKAMPWISVPLDAEADVSPVDGHWMTAKEWSQTEDHWSLKA